MFIQTTIYHGNNCVDCLWCSFLSTWLGHNTGAQVGHIEGDAFQDTFRGLATFFFQFWNLQIYFPFSFYFGNLTNI